MENKQKLINSLKFFNNLVFDQLLVWLHWQILIHQSLCSIFIWYNTVQQNQIMERPNLTTRDGIEYNEFEQLQNEMLLRNISITIKILDGQVNRLQKNPRYLAV